MQAHSIFIGKEQSYSDDFTCLSSASKPNILHITISKGTWTTFHRNFCTYLAAASHSSPVWLVFLLFHSWMFQHLIETFLIRNCFADAALTKVMFNFLNTYSSNNNNHNHTTKFFLHTPVLKYCYMVRIYSVAFLSHPLKIERISNTHNHHPFNIANKSIYNHT